MDDAIKEIIDKPNMTTNQRLDSLLNELKVTDTNVVLFKLKMTNRTVGNTAENASKTLVSNLSSLASDIEFLDFFSTEIARFNNISLHD